MTPVNCSKCFKMLTNCLDKIQNFHIDHSKSFTPFTIKKVKGELVKTYTDHKAIVFDLNLNFDLTKLRSVEKTLTWMYNSIENDIKYEIVTDDSIDWLLYIIENERDIDKVIKNHKKVIRAEFSGVSEGSIKQSSVQGAKK